MFKKIIFVALLALPLATLAQTKFGYLSYQNIYRNMPEYGQAQETLKNLKVQYDAEAKRSESEFNRKFAEFLQGQKEFPANILQKRQRELQDLMEKSMEFKQEIAIQLDSAKSELQRPIENKLNEAIKNIGSSKKYAFIINTDEHACPFIDPTQGEDVTDLIKAQLTQK